MCLKIKKRYFISIAQVNQKRIIAHILEWKCVFSTEVRD